MKIALLADIHANLEAFEACMTHAQARGAERHVFIGDLVGYNADPVAVLDRIAMQVRDKGAIAVLGNHDEAAITQAPFAMNEIATRAIEWTRAQLKPQHIDFLAALPLTQRDSNILFVHASAVAPEQWVYIFDGRRAAASIEAAGTNYVFSGHVHEPTLYYCGSDGQPQAFAPVSGVTIPVAGHRKWLAIVGSCGQPRDGNPAACYALMDTDKERLTFFRVPYDYAAAARKVRSAGLPEALARRLETGI